MLNIDIEQLRTLVRLIAQSQLASVEVTVGDTCVSVENRASHAATDAPAVTTAIDKQPIPNQSPNQDVLAIHSPYVGRFKTAPDEISAACVQVGDHVQIGDTIGYIASLARLLPVVSENAGTVTSVLDHDARVEYDSVLVTLG